MIQPKTSRDTLQELIAQRCPVHASGPLQPPGPFEAGSSNWVQRELSHLEYSNTLINHFAPRLPHILT